MNREKYNHLSREILDASITVHREMGSGLLELVYENCLMKELELRRIFAEKPGSCFLNLQGF